MELTVKSTNEQLKQYYNRLNALLAERGMESLPNVTVRWSTYMSSRKLGHFHVRGGPRDSAVASAEIVLNRNVLASLNFSVEETLRHEAAHAWTWFNCGRLDHSDAWRHVAKILGCTGSRCASYRDSELAPIAQATSRETPTQHTELTAKRLHQLRCSLKYVCREKGLTYCRSTYDLHVRPKFPQFSKDLLEAAATQLFKA